MAITTKKKNKASAANVNQSMMTLIKKAHGLIENTDIEKHRHSQDQVGAFFGYTKEVTVKEVEIEDMAGEWVCVDRAHMKKYVILYCHGGGYSTGSSVYARTLTTKLATSTSIDVLSFDYRLAPEHPFPAALEDAMKAWNYLMQFGYGARDVIVAGDSAGGNLALCLVHKLKQEERLLPRGLILMSPWTDLTSAGRTHQTMAELDPVLNAPYLDRMIENYAAGQDLINSFISPVFGEFAGFPPTYIQVGEFEILLSDSTQLHKELIKANVPVKLDVFEGMWHVFQMSPLKIAYEAMEKNAQFIFDVCI